jgi:hypothetical protein
MPIERFCSVKIRPKGKFVSINVNEGGKIRKRQNIKINKLFQNLLDFTIWKKPLCLLFSYKRFFKGRNNFMSVELEDRGRALENEYFRRKEQELIEKMKANLSAKNAQSSGMKCPRCDGKLLETDYENIKIDVCESCSGAWLDAGELAQVVDKDEGKSWVGRIFS